MTKVVLAVLFVLASTPARAQRAEADAAFELGRELMKKGDYEKACDAFETSLRLEATIGTLYNLGLCHEKLGKLASAYTELKQVSERDTNKGRAADAAKRAALLEPRLTKMKLVAEPTAGLVIERDGIDITGFVGQTVPVDPRRYTFTATAPGLEPYTTTIDLTAEGATVDVKIPALSTKAGGSDPVTPGAPLTGYPRVLARRPFNMPDGMYELTAQTLGATSDTMFGQAPIDAGIAARIGIQKFELGLRAGFHVRYAETDSTRPKPWKTVTGTFAYAIAPMFVGRLEYTRYHPVGDIGDGTDLRLGALRKLLVAPRIAIAGSAGFVYYSRGDGGEANELVLETTFGPQFTATDTLSLEAVAELGINAGGELFDHTISLGFAPAFLYAASQDLDIFARIFVGLLPAVEGSSSSDFRSVTIGVNWRP